MDVRAFKKSHKKISKLNENIDKIFATTDKTDLVFKLIGDYKVNTTILHNALQTVAKESAEYINQYGLQDQLHKCETLIEKYDKIWSNIKFCVDDVNSKINFDEIEDEELQNYALINEKDIYQLPILEKVLYANEKLKSTKGPANAFHDTSVNWLNEFKILIQDSMFVDSMNNLQFKTYDAFITKCKDLQMRGDNLQKVYTIYHDIHNALDISNFAQDGAKNVDITTQETYYNSILNKFTAILGFKAQYFTTTTKNVLGKETTWLEWIKFWKAEEKSKEGTNKEASINISDEFKNIDDPFILEIIHEKFQAFTEALVDRAKIECFKIGIQKLQDGSACKVRSLKEDIKENFETQCGEINKVAKDIVNNCKQMFYMETIHDELIEKAIVNASTIRGKSLDDEAHSLLICSQTECQLLDPEVTDAKKVFTLENPKDILVQDAIYDNNEV
ncbi:hypothetical protein RFI_25803 [Reticulomyxa filosa]|uniref:Uncharacterized protein n=1 Tax=Reticulomyxa filosa TaxID=46433 RepID=X6MCH9_RETFI|nr:hypothetical protein RFI_25803 [Reticulomyxa filosa]|eukprot:ETO11574.1 hypothetical protein RFI_25803 [Reticulomyxa filosa]